MEYLNKITHSLYTIVEFKEPDSTKESKTYQEQSPDADQILALEQTIEILQEQIKTLEQELQYEQLLVEEYDQERCFTNSEMSALNCKIYTN